MTTPKRTIATLLSAGMLLAAPGPVMAQGGAGDQQYQDPLGQVTKPAKKKAHHKLVCKTRRQKHTRACKRLAAKRRAAARHHGRH